jgi:hypothetical protein
MVWGVKKAATAILSAKVSVSTELSLALHLTMSLAN